MESRVKQIYKRSSTSWRLPSAYIWAHCDRIIRTTIIWYVMLPHFIIKLSSVALNVEVFITVANRGEICRWDTAFRSQQESRQTIRQQHFKVFIRCMTKDNNNKTAISITITNLPLLSTASATWQSWFILGDVRNHLGKQNYKKIKQDEGMWVHQRGKLFITLNISKK